MSTTVDVTTTPLALLRVTPLRRVDAGGVASFDASPAELSSIQGPTCALQRRRRLRCRSTGALPRPKSARTPHVTNSCPRLPEKQAQSGWDKVPMNSPADSTGPSAPGLHCPTFREESQVLRHPRCLPSMGSPEGLAPRLHRLSPTCGVAGCGAFFIDAKISRR